MRDAEGDKAEWVRVRGSGEKIIGGERGTTGRALRERVNGIALAVRACHLDEYKGNVFV